MQVYVVRLLDEDDEVELQRVDMVFKDRELAEKYADGLAALYPDVSIAIDTVDFIDNLTT